MPSDPTGTHPIGVLARPAPDFFDDNMGLVAFNYIEFNPPAGLHYQTIALYNNAKSGVLFKVYAIVAECNGGGGLSAWFAPGTVGTLQNGAGSLRPDVGVPYGQLYFQQTDVAAGVPNPFIPAGINGIVPTGGFDSNIAAPGFPLFIVPVGYSLVLSNISSSVNTGASFWYQLANE